MKFLDDIDMKILKENYDETLVKQINVENIVKIFDYLYINNVYYAKDLFLNSLDLFLLPYGVFVEKFERLKKRLGDEFVDKLGEDSSLIEIMYE